LSLKGALSNFPVPSPPRLRWPKTASSAPPAQSGRPIPPLSHLF
jgi:hypothetical protein